MQVSEYFDRIRKCTDQGRSVEMALFGETYLFHICTCYVDDLTKRSAIRFDVAVYGLPINKIAAKYAQYIDPRAPIMMQS